MNRDELYKYLQGFFTDGIAIVVGSGLSAAEGIPGMPALAKYLSDHKDDVAPADRALWTNIQTSLDDGVGLEAALLRTPPTEAMESWISRCVAELLATAERSIILDVLQGSRTLRLSMFLQRILKPANGLPILTTNYDRLIEVACEMSGYHVDTTAIGLYSGSFDHKRSCMASCKGIVNRGRIPMLDHHPRAIVLKPHGSFDWYLFPDGPRRCSIDLIFDRLIITPGLNKYRAGYDSPFDKHRELANEHINRATRLLIIGYGFNDDHLQTHLVKRMKEGIPTLIMTRSADDKIRGLVLAASNCYCLNQHPKSTGFQLISSLETVDYEGIELWDIGVLAKEVLQ